MSSVHTTQTKQERQEGKEKYDGPERRFHLSNSSLTEEEMEEIAERAAEKAIAKVTQDLYTSIGKAVLTKVVWSVGVAWVALIIWLNAKGLIKF